MFAAVLVIGAFCVPNKLTPCPDGGGYFPGDACLSSILPHLIKIEINHRLSVAEEHCGKDNAEVQYAYWDDLSEFEDRFGQFCIDYSQIVAATKL